MKNITVRPLTAAAFAPYGNLIDFDRDPDFAINNGMCDRYHNLAVADAAGPGARAIISLGRARPHTLPLTLETMERHPLGSQAFIPLEPNPFLVVVAPDTPAGPGIPLAFLTRPGQGVSYYRNVWHAVLTPLDKTTDFVIVDRLGDGENQEQHVFAEPYLIADT